jgi:uncharacterized protein (TIGR03437 family)
MVAASEWRSCSTRKFNPVATVHPNEVIILYAAGLGPTDDSGRVTDPVEVYLGERKAQVTFAGFAPGISGVYQLNVIAPALATDRIYLRSGGWQSNIVYMGPVVYPPQLTGVF